MNYDVIVVGAGHAGCEAALAAARLGLKTLILTINPDKIALMPCNPSIGGVGKSQLVSELDALGGQMAKVADKTYIQLRVLNKRKGPAVQALRAQIDKKEYEIEMKRVLENTENLTLRQGTVNKILVKNDTVTGVSIESGLEFKAKAVIVTTGTFLRGRIIIGRKDYHAGRMGEYPAMNLTNNLISLGFKIGRFQTATPPRVDKRTLDLSKTEIQRGEEEPVGFSIWNKGGIRKNIECYLTYTNKKTNEIVRKNIEESPIKSGMVDTHGPRHCPSIDRKVINFPEKTRHPIFIEPEGENTNEMYLQGLTTSMPPEIQQKIINTVSGLENARIIRPGYAVEYDYIIPNQLNFTLESKKISNLYFAGQINGTSGYEEAAVQGFLSGVNAAQKIKNRPPLILTRDNSYIGVLIDDLITKELIEPYRMYTSRAEYRLILRCDNADIRLSGYGKNIGLITSEQYKKVLNKENKINEAIEKLKSIWINPGKTTIRLFENVDTKLMADTSLSAYKLLKRPGVNIDDITGLLNDSNGDYDKDILKQVEIIVKYEGYINRQLNEIKKMEGLEKYYLPQDLNYFDITGLTYEAKEKLSEIRPNTLGQASRIAGISPADISILMLNLKGKLKKVKQFGY
ncbi:MAG: tRNA uridine-5-carboxymethylaminomethyl(34) synthesis enzyme MnmG [Candidatus Humimicrobiaceae bacterium]|jgi:tRNA uridine 5-carboxymethylaminomethyl modification enzyme|nr:tRNA uridine-5-carboxymethylaminomethyl(34) synthesis enzyme MnmG [Actinomycetota bacterium]MDD5600298.1 tRNA uridine-5-carboxymethylaminomethyl(34) synthesis enzyme MnmG [Actinomycetota bacterium]MDY0027693.1 tRNA uridine-5-carboxymethylaminomethyl(34) synthesis enzyme MnmG [Candidatus Humimicrobiaceae bacterium]